ncbi:hypothetical protein C816_03008 [Oscillibacter sp. 1-3]|nr:hypothetical protein C816_03008 [Oscillibacter sp. 1-3]
MCKIDDLITLANEMGCTELAGLLISVKPRLNIQSIEQIKTEDPDPSCQKTLYLSLNRNDITSAGKFQPEAAAQENQLCFNSLESLYKTAYQLQTVFAEHKRIWYEKIIETNLRFNDITLKQPNLLTMIQYFHSLMKNPVIIYDEFFDVTDITDERISEYDRDESDLQRCEMHNLFYYKQRVFFSRPDAPKPGCTRLLYPVLLGGMPKGYLAIFDLETPYEEMDMMILEIFANSVLTEMRRRLELRNVEYKFVSDFIYDLIYRKENKEEEIKRRAKRLGVTINANYCFLAINPAGPMNELKFDTNGYITQYEFMNDRIMNHIENFNRKVYKQDIVSKFNTTIYILHRTGQHGNGESYDDMKAYCGKLLHMLEQQFDGMHFQIGIGDIVQGLTNVSASYHQVWATISYGELINGKGQSFIACYADNSLLRLFMRLNEIGGLEEVIPQNLQDIWSYDRQNHTQLYDTLKVYLECNCNARRASEKLFIHYKTMLYRIEKLKHTFRIDLENGTARLFLELGIHLLDIQRDH